MIKDIIINSNLIVIKTDSKEELEKFIKIFTIFDKNKAAKTLFKEEVSIEYREEGDIDIVNLIKNKSFNYTEVETIVDHLCKHGITVGDQIVEYAFTQASNKLDHQNIVFCSYQKRPQLNIRIDKGKISIRPMAKEHLSLNSANSQKFIKLLQKENSLYNYTIENNIIYILGYAEVHDTVSFIAQILLKCCLIQKEDNELIIEQLIQIAFKDFTISELKVIKNIASYPNYHPLSKYKNIAREIEDIFLNLADDNLSMNSVNKLKSALNQEGEFSLAPKIIMKSIFKLDKNFHNKLNSLIMNETN